MRVENYGSLTAKLWPLSSYWPKTKKSRPQNAQLSQNFPPGKQPDKTLSASLPQKTAQAIHFSAYTTAFQSVFLP